MATPPIGGGPLDPNKGQNQNTGGEQSKATGAPNFGPVQDAINNMASASLKMTETLEKIFDRMEKTSKAASDVADNLKDAVQQSDNLESNLRAALNVQKDFNNNIK